MKLLIITILTSLLFVSCVQRDKKNKDSQISTETLTSSIKIQPKLDSLLEQGVYEVVNDIEYIKKSDSLSECVMIMYFRNKFVEIHYYACTSKKNYYTVNDYKGVMNLGDYRIAIFDRDSLGQGFYNMDSLQLVPFDSFKCCPMNVIITKTFYIKHGRLLNWKEGLREESE